VETHRAVFRWFVWALGAKGLLNGQTLGIDAATLDANADAIDRAARHGREVRGVLNGLSHCGGHR
jgi:hypothetical protein